jgi:hypothetical protein
MKRILFLLPLLVFIISSELLSAQELSVGEALHSNIMNKTFFPLFEALRSGDTEAIKNYISGDMYHQKKVLLEENKDYPRFLREFYRGANFSVERAVLIDGDIIANVVIEFPDGDKSHVLLRLTISGDQRWKVANDLSNLPVKLAPDLINRKIQ